ncbi:MAG TPA: hypothetical protein VK524_29885 [Polyangiaceae bacterium]|nr:hypothetical protein [Polyangiaceae bacterium]
MRERIPSRAACLGAAFAALCSACTREDKPADSTFYDRRIAPVVRGSCATSPTFSGCHVAADDRGNALGNLNVQSYDTLNLRRDLFINYGPYGYPALLLKVLPPQDLRLTSWDNETQTTKSDIAHVGGSLLDVTSSSYAQLERWIANGASENNAPVARPKFDIQPCSTALGIDPSFDPSAEPATPDYADFDVVNSILAKRCAGGNCHGSPTNSLYLTCGSSEEEKRWNYFAAGDHVSVDPAASDILTRALDPAQGGTYHEGGTVFQNRDDPDYILLRTWAEAKGGPTNIPTDEGFDFFAKRVQPVLAKRGCMMVNCHSPAMFHDYRLRGGSGGHFTLATTRVNYRFTLEQAGLESPDPNASRLIRKNLLPTPTGGGILHRGGPLFSSGGDPSACDAAAAETGPLDDTSAYCVLVTWLAKEREARLGSASGLTGIAYVRRPAKSGADTPQDYAQFSAGAEVLLAQASLSATGDVSVSGSTSLSSLCGLDPASSDARRPAVSWDGARIAFAARSSASEPFRVYVVEGGSCAPDATINAAAVDESGAAIPTNGELVHNFDPAFAPDGRIVFASTRGNVMNVAQFSYSGPQRSPADPAKLNANLYIAGDGSVRQLTFQLNQELAPAFMGDGRLIFTTEKRAPEFYQLAGRRMNLDGGDYHPLFGQRSSIGFTQMTDFVELTDKNFVAIASERGAAHGAGTLVVINRSIGIDFQSGDEADYLQDPGAIDWPNPVFFQRSMRVVDAQATGRLSGTSGAYRNPSPLPNGKLLVSYAANVQNLASFSGNFDIHVVNHLTGARAPLITGASDELWPVAVYARQNHGVFESKLAEPNGATSLLGDPDRSRVMFLDVPLFTSLVFQNTRSPRVLPPGNTSLNVWESLPPEPGVTSFGSGGPFITEDQYGPLYVRRQLRGPVRIYGDGSALMDVPGGVPLVLSTRTTLAGESGAAEHFQREEMSFYPGEVVRQGFRRSMFNGLCGGCHGSVSGFESDNAVKPDILTRASEVAARTALPTDLMGTQGSPQGPPFP